MGGFMKRYNVGMILNDWRAGRPSKRICEIYGFKSLRQLRRKVAEWRDAGWPFERRKAGRPKKPRGIKITDVWHEEVTAGSILQSLEEAKADGHHEREDGT